MQRRWTRSTLGRLHRIETESPGLTALGEVGPGPTLTQEIELLTPTRTVFSVFAPVSIGTKDPRRFQFDTRRLTLRTADAVKLHAYTVRSLPDPTDADLAALSGGPSESEGVAVVRQFRHFDEQVRLLARRLLESNNLAPEPPA